MTPPVFLLFFFMVFELHSVFTEFSRVLPSFTGFYRVLLGFKPNGCLLFSKSKGFLLSFILFFFTEFYWVFEDVPIEIGWRPDHSDQAKPSKTR